LNSGVGYGRNPAPRGARQIRIEHAANYHFLAYPQEKKKRILSIP
jgi:hypothetical protein